jgi:hypothetical protein
MLHVLNMLVFTYQQHCKPTLPTEIAKFAKTVLWGSCVERLHEYPYPS